MAEEKLFYVSLKALVKKANKVLVMHSSNDNSLDFPGGKINQGEDNLGKVLQREVREETNLMINILKPFAVWINDWETPKYARGSIVVIGYSCEYLSGEIKLSDEHSGYQWVTKQDYKTIDDGSAYFNALDIYVKQFLS